MQLQVGNRDFRASEELHSSGPPFHGLSFSDDQTV